MPSPVRHSDSQILNNHLVVSEVKARGGLAALLKRLAGAANQILVAAFGGALIAAGAAVSGFGAAALVIASVSGTLVILAFAAALSRLLYERRDSVLSASLLQTAEFDPDPLIITTLNGAPRAANPAAREETDPVRILGAWCVEATSVVAALLGEVEATGGVTREFWRQKRGLRLSVHRLDAAGYLVAWRFSALNRGGGRYIDDLGMPVITRDTEGVRANAATRSLIDPGAETTQVLEAVEAARDADEQMPLALTLHNGVCVRALPVGGRDGLLDVVLMPAWRVLQEGEGAAASNFEEIPVALMQIDAEGRIDETNRHARALLGVAEGDRRFFWEVVEGLGRPVADWLEDARNGRTLGRPEVLRAPLTGQDTFVQIILRRATAPEMQGALVAVVSDATELKSLEARFVQSQKMQAIGQLAGGVAHDFNNLLTAISGHCDLLLLNRDRFDPDYNDLLQIHQNANRAAALVRQLLAFSRKQTMKSEVLRLESLLEDLTHLLTRLVGERITVSLSHDPDVGAIRADRRQLEQVIMNLVVNARDAMPMGGTIRIETQSLRLREERELGRARIPPGTYALIRVIDQGLGIPDDIIDKIFEPFFTTKKLGEGTGLGLSTAYGIVKQMGGYIFADSFEGAGTVFTLYFGIAAGVEALDPVQPGRMSTTHTSKDAARAFTSPVTLTAKLGGFDQPAAPFTTIHPSPQSAAAHTGDARPVVASRGASVLLVEDEAPVRAFAARALRLQGYQVFEAQDGEQALEFLAESTIRVDIFVTDVIMPGIDGPGWVAEALVSRPGTPVVFVSGHTADTFSAALNRTPRAVFLGKPFSLKDLTDTIAQQLDPPGVAARA